MARRMILLVIPFLLSLFVASVAVAADDSTVMVRQDAALGSLLTDPKGMTLYLFTKDTGSTSVCYDACAKAWPPLIASGALTLPAGTPGVLGTTTRKDGANQVTYNGIPLYYFAADAAPGDTKGQNVGKVWFIVAPKDAVSKLPTTGGFPAEFVLIGGLALVGAGLKLRKH